MKRDKHLSLKLLAVLLFFVVLWFFKREGSLKLGVPLISVIIIISFIFINENKNTTIKEIFTGILLGAMAMSYSYITGLITSISYIASVSVFKKYNYNVFTL